MLSRAQDKIMPRIIVTKMPPIKASRSPIFTLFFLCVCDYYPFPLKARLDLAALNEHLEISADQAIPGVRKIVSDLPFAPFVRSQGALLGAHFASFAQWAMRASAMSA